MDFKPKNKLVGNIISLFVLQGSNYILPLITFPYLVRVLGVNTFGLLAFASSFIQYFNLITDYGFNLSATQDISIHRNDRQQISRIYSSVLWAKVILLALSLIIMTIIIVCAPKFRRDWLLFYITFLVVLGNVLFPTWFFQGLEIMRTITVIQLISKFMMTMSIFLFVHHQSDYLIAALIQSMVQVISGIIAVIWIRVNYGIKLILPTKKELFNNYKKGWHIFISTIAISIYTTSNLFILGLLTNNTVVGLFSSADKIIKAVQGLFSPISQAIYPYINSLAVKSKMQAILFINRCVIWLGLGSFVVSLLLFFFADSIVHLLLGSAYNGSIAMVRCMAIIPFLVMLSNIFGIQTMLTFGMKKIFSRILIFSGLLNLIYIFPLVLTYQGLGAAISVDLTEFFVTFIMGYYLMRKKLINPLLTLKQKGDGIH